MFSHQETCKDLEARISNLKAIPQKDDNIYRELSKTFWELSEVWPKHGADQWHNPAKKSVHFMLKLNKHTPLELKAIEAQERCDTLGLNSKLIRDCLLKEKVTNPKKVQDTMDSIDNLIKAMQAIKSIHDKWLEIDVPCGLPLPQADINAAEKKDDSNYIQNIYPFDELAAKCDTIANNSDLIASAIIYSHENEKARAVRKQLISINNDLNSYENYRFNHITSFIPGPNLRKQAP